MKLDGRLSTLLGHTPDQAARPLRRDSGRNVAAHRLADRARFVAKDRSATAAVRTAHVSESKTLTCSSVRRAKR